MTMLASLVSPAYQAGRWLPRTVPSWLDQDLDGPFEVLVVDNGSTDGAVESLPDHPRLHRLHERRPGAYAARNTGARAARGRFLVFVDPDCAAAPGWLRRLLAPLVRDDRVQASQGPAHPARGHRVTRLVGIYEEHRERYVYASADPRLYYAHTNNLAVRREAFERCGPFDLRLRGADTMLARRIVDTFGCAAMVHAPDAAVEHLEVDGCSHWMRKTYLYGRHRHDARTGRDDVRSLTLGERLRVWRAASRAERLSPPLSAALLGTLALGCACWWAGGGAGMLSRMVPPSRAEARSRVAGRTGPKVEEGS